MYSGAVMAWDMLKDGKIIRTETGATPVSKQQSVRSGVTGAGPGRAHHALGRLTRLWRLAPNRGDSAPALR